MNPRKWLYIDDSLDISEQENVSVSFDAKDISSLTCLKLKVLCLAAGKFFAWSRSDTKNVDCRLYFILAKSK